MNSITIQRTYKVDVYFDEECFDTPEAFQIFKDRISNDPEYLKNVYNDHVGDFGVDAFKPITPISIINK